MNPDRCRTVVVLKRDSGNRLKGVVADIGGDRITIVRAGVFGQSHDTSDGSGRWDLNPLPRHDELSLVLVSNRAVCRLFALPTATREQTRRMASLRLETELPYPVADSAWVCERQTGGAPNVGGNVLVIAAPTGDISPAEKNLRSVGVRCNSVTLDVAALAELATSSHYTEDTLAVAAVGEMTTVLAIVDRGKLRYARRIMAGSVDPNVGNAATAGVRRLAEELHQSIHHYALHDGSREPLRMILVGEGAGTEQVVTALSDRVGIPVDVAPFPENMSIEAASIAEDNLLMEFPACVGAVLAMHNTLRGNPTAAPVLRSQRAPLIKSVQINRTVLIGINLVLFAAVIATLFIVRTAHISVGRRIGRQGDPSLADMDRLKSEVGVLEYENALQRSILDSLLALSGVMPKGVKAETLTIDHKGKIAISGIAGSVEDASEKAISAMKASKVFMNPKFLGATKVKKGFKFRITCELRKRSGVRKQ